MSQIEIIHGAQNDVMIRIRGSFDGRETSEINGKIRDTLSSHTDVKQFIIDVSEVTYLNSNGIGILIYTYLHLKQQNITTLFITGTDQNSFINRLFRETHLDSVFTYITTLSYPMQETVQ